MIKEIKIKDVATFSEEVVIDKLKKINIIYGANGSGKSTISKVLNDINNYPSCVIKWEEDKKVQVLTYNKEFVSKNFATGKMPGIFTLGQDTKETYEKIESERNELMNIKGEKKKANDDKNGKKEERKVTISEFKESAWKYVLKKHEEDFPKGAIKTYTKDDFFEKLLQHYGESATKNLDDLKSRANTLYSGQSTVKKEIPLIQGNIESIEKNKIWSKSIVGSNDVDIAKLIKTLNNGDWVKKGWDYVLQSNNDICPFCQQHTIDDKFKKSISSFFDGEYNEGVKLVKDLNKQYKQKSDDLLESIEKIINEESVNEKSMMDVPKVQKELEILKSTISANLKEFWHKEIEPSVKINLKDTAIYVNNINTEIQSANESIKSHNQLVSDSENQKRKLCNEILDYFAYFYKDEIDKYKKKLEELENEIKSFEASISKKDQEIKEKGEKIEQLEKSITSIKPTIDRINEVLKAFCFTNFKLQETEQNSNHYQIVRENGEPAKETLSEGESTFITFLYYTQLVDGAVNTAPRESDNSQLSNLDQEKILVIDDPISSLDSNVLFIVSEMIKELFGKVRSEDNRIKQIFVLTHNIYFHKEISNIREGKKDIVQHFILRKNENVSSIQAYGSVTPIKTSYDLLWSEFKNSNLSCGVLQNTMRRIIEYYFKTVGGYTQNQIIKEFKGSEEMLICKSLISWMNDGSHSLSEDLYVQMQEDQVKKYKKVFKNIFYRLNQGPHYEMMMRDIQSDNENKN